MSDKYSITNSPELIEDQALDTATGGIALLLPAVQKVRASDETQVATGGLTKVGAGTLSF